jgi:subtilisin-like proprotein convertase family protein
MNKKILLLTMPLLLAVASARGTLYTETFSPGTVIPEGSPVGVTITGSVSGIPAGMTVGALTVGVDISGGYNGGLFAYLVAPNGTTVMLMNQPGVGVNGFGASGAGLNITLSDAGGTSIQDVTSGSVLSGTYSAAGSLSGFNGSAADGTWTLFFADLTSGGGSPDLLSWSLGITAVPEPVSLALVVLLGLLALHWCLGRCWSRPVSGSSLPDNPAWPEGNSKDVGTVSPSPRGRGQG